MQYYNPMAVRPQQGAMNGTKIEPDASDTTVSGLAPAKSNVRASAQTGEGPGWNGNRLGNITMDMLGSEQWGRGESFQGGARMGVMDALNSAKSTANADDVANMDALRSYYASALKDLPGQTADHISTYDTQAQRGLKNMLSQYTNAQAGTGRIGSRQFSGAQGDITSKANSDYMTALLNARSAAIGQAGQIQSGMHDTYNQDLQERQFQQDQAQRLSDQIIKLMNLDQGREAQLESERYDKDKTNTAMKYQAASNERAYAHDFWSNMGGSMMGGA